MLHVFGCAGSQIRGSDGGKERCFNLNRCEDTPIVGWVRRVRLRKLLFCSTRVRQYYSVRADRAVIQSRGRVSTAVLARHIFWRMKFGPEKLPLVFLQHVLCSHRSQQGPAVCQVTADPPTRPIAVFFFGNGNTSAAQLSPLSI